MLAVFVMSTKSVPKCANLTRGPQPPHGTRWHNLGCARAAAAIAYRWAGAHGYPRTSDRYGCPPALMLTVPDNAAWLRNDRETDQHWAFFQYYRTWAYPDEKAGLAGRYRPRDLTVIAKELGEPESGLRALARASRWGYRAARFDAWVDARLSDDGLSEAVVARRGHIRMLTQARHICEIELGKLYAKAMDPEASELSPREILKYLELIVKAERLLHGEATENVAVQVGWNIESLEIEDLRELDRIRGKLLPSGG